MAGSSRMSIAFQARLPDHQALLIINYRLVQYLKMAT